MEEVQRRLGIRIPGVLLPSAGTDLYKWAVIACDQFTSQPEYWEDAARIVGDAPSTLHMIYPEVYLGEKDESQRIEVIVAAMERYLQNGVLTEYPPGVMVTWRRNASGTLVRKGVMLSVDLECYDYEEGSASIIRATEGTIRERIPPRLRIRSRAPVDLPHVMMLVDDARHTVIEPMYARANKAEPVYDTELMLGGGHVRAWHVTDPGEIERMLLALDALLKASEAWSPGAPMLFAVGDGNHSLAAAKANWENVKRSITKDAAGDHPARFALCEILNLYDEGIRMEPIHRLLFDVDTDKALSFLIGFYRDKGMKARLLKPGETVSAGQALEYSAQDGPGMMHIADPRNSVVADTLQAGLDALLGAFPKARIDYIHGRDALQALSKAPGCLGFLLPQIRKDTLFSTVMKGGVLPRKAFSIGEADEKRYYMEGKRIRP